MDFHNFSNKTKLMIQKRKSFINFMQINFLFEVRMCWIYKF